MCGRYTFEQPAASGGETRALFDLLLRKYPMQEPPQGDVCPGQLAPVYLARQGKARLELLHWGFPNPYRKGLLINARAETAGEKALFRPSLHSMRCAVPCTAFYEWDSQKRLYRCSFGGANPLYLAGLYRVFEGESCFVILTVPANASVAPVHHRMPLLLQRVQVRPWLTDASAAIRILAQPMPALHVTPCPPKATAQTSLFK